MPAAGSTHQQPRPPPAYRATGRRVWGLSGRGGGVSRGSVGKWKCRGAGERRNE